MTRHASRNALLIASTRAHECSTSTPDECVDCGACEPVCPVEAIYYEDDLPDQWSGYTQINADFFTELGSPGGASKIGITENDPIAVKSLDRVDSVDKG
jgi:ferredoxin